MRKPLRYLMIVGSASVLVVVGCEATRAGYESAPYKVARAEGRFEVREYPELVVVETGTGGAGKDADGSFGRLFGFISGRNREGTKIAMTTPVFMAGEGDARTMAFVMPSEMAAGEVPKPTDDAVAVRELEAGTFATMRFSGSRDAARELRALEALEGWLEREGLKAEGTPVYGYFDPPWTPTFLRRNEVMVRVKDDGSEGAEGAGGSDRSDRSD